VLHLNPGVELSRRVWLSPGAYDVRVVARGSTTVSLDGRSVLAAGATEGPATLAGHVHRLVLTLPDGGMLRGLVIRRRTAVSGSTAAAARPVPDPGMRPGGE